MRRGTSGVASAITWGDGQAAPAVTVRHPNGPGMCSYLEQNRRGRSTTVKRQRLNGLPYFAFDHLLASTSVAMSPGRACIMAGRELVQ